MKLPLQKPLLFHDPAKPFAWGIKWQEKYKTASLSSLQFLEKIKSIGFTPQMEDYEKRKLGIFNQLNFFQLLAGIIVPIAGMIRNRQFPPSVWAIALIPPMISILVLWLNSRREYFGALLSYFVAYPFATCIVYLSGVNLGVELSFILYGILSVFFLQEISQMLFALGLSMVSYFVLAVVCKNYTYQLATANVFLYFFNQLMAIGFIFYGLFLVKKENTGYQFSILQQKEEIVENEKLLKRQTEELMQVNAFKNRLFSIIAHDLKSPIYALRTLFRNMQQYDTPAEDIKGMVPEVVNELTYTTSLMENLLQWARSQMQADAVKPQMIDIPGLVTEVGRLLRLQAEAKGIQVSQKVDGSVRAFADKDMVNLILRNLLSNAIKYTPEGGKIEVGVCKGLEGAEIYVKDSGMGMSEEALEKIHLNNYYTTKGTAGESGTGLGLMLCREFAARNGGKLEIGSQVGVGSIFTVTLPEGERGPAH